MDEQLKRNLTEGSVWVHGLFMVLFYVVFHVMEIIVGFIAIVQFALMLFTRTPNENLQSLGHRLGEYMNYTILFLTAQRMEKPYPFSDWSKMDD